MAFPLKFGPVLRESLRPRGQEDVMKRKRHTPEQIVGHLRDAELMDSEGKSVAQIC